MPKRNLAPPQFKFKIWKPDGKLWFTDPIDLQAIIKNANLSEVIIKSRMGFGYSHISEALSGKRLDRWAIQMIEHGLSTETSPPPSTYHPP